MALIVLEGFGAWMATFDRQSPGREHTNSRRGKKLSTRCRGGSRLGAAAEVGLRTQKAPHRGAFASAGVVGLTAHPARVAARLIAIRPDIWPMSRDRSLPIRCRSSKPDLVDRSLVPSHKRSSRRCSNAARDGTEPARRLRFRRCRAPMIATAAPPTPIPANSGIAATSSAGAKLLIGSVIVTSRWISGAAARRVIWMKLPQVRSVPISVAGRTRRRSHLCVPFRGTTRDEAIPP